MRIVDVVQNLGEFARMANDPQPGKAMAIFLQRPVDAFQGKADKICRLNDPFERQLQKTAREPLTEVPRGNDNFMRIVTKCDPHINLD